MEPAVEDPKRRRLASDASGIRPTVNTNKPRSHADVDSSIIAFIVSVALFVGGSYDDSVSEGMKSSGASNVTVLVLVIKY